MSDESFKWLGWLYLITLALAITSLTTLSIQKIPTDLQEGMIASRDIKANRNYEIVDEEASQKFRDEAAKGVLPVYDFDKELSKITVDRITDAFRTVREQAAEYSKVNLGYKSKNWKLTDEEAENLKKIFTERSGIEPAPNLWKAILLDKASPDFEGHLENIVGRILLKLIISGEDLFKEEQGVLLRMMGDDSEKKLREQVVTDFKIFITMDEAKDLIGRDQQIPKPFFEMAALFIKPNINFNRFETEKRKSEATKSVKEVILKIKAGEIVVRNGSRYDERTIKLLKGIAKERQRTNDIYTFVGIFILVVIMMLVPFYLSKRFLPRFNPTRADYFLMSVVALAMVMLFRIFLSIAPAISGAFFVQVPSEALNYAIPVAAGAILLRLLLPAAYAMVFSIVISIFASLFLETNFYFVAYSLISNFSAIIMFNNIDRRSGMMMGSIHLGALNALTVGAILLVGVGKFATPISLSEVFAYTISAFMGGVFSAVIAIIAMPIAEGLSGHISDIKLLELSNLNHPLLRELIVRAPGTYHHSHLVGILAEAAAEKVGANSLLVRVASYYHDIGKMRKPQYFVENSFGDDKHDKLSPNMSALILMAHVKDGLDMANEAHLPRAISNMIPEHHGTRLISYFYDKAKQMENEKQTVDKKDFCYQGPRPQSRESAILMLADAAEAAVRSLKEKNASRIQQTVQKIINECFAESELDECDLTLKDLNAIAGAFTHILLGIYHQRIEYPQEGADSKPDVAVVDGEKIREVSNAKSEQKETKSK